MKTKRAIRLLLFVAVASVFLPRQIGAQEQKRNYEIDDLINVVKLSSRAILIRTGVDYFDVVSAIATEKGIVVIDAGNTPQLTEKYRKIISKEFGRDDFIYLINTHSHRDHTGGNQVFADTKIIGHERSKQAMIREWNDMDDYRGMLQSGIKEKTEQLKNLDINSAPGKQAYYSLTLSQMVQKDIEPGGKHVTTPPAITFDDTMTLSLGNITIEIMYFGNAHSEGDTWIYIPEEKLLFSGDVFFKGGTGNLTYFGSEETQGINEVKRWRKILNYLSGAERTVNTIIRGHGDIMTLSDLKIFCVQIEDIWKELETGKELYPLVRLENILNKEGINAVRAECKKLQADKNKYLFLERGFVVIGNRFKKNNATEAANELYKLYTEIFPRR